jgi:hypothetical protein
MNIKYIPTAEDSLEKIVKFVSESFKSELTKEKLNHHLNKLISIEKIR